MSTRLRNLASRIDLTVPMFLVSALAALAIAAAVISVQTYRGAFGISLNAHFELVNQTCRPAIALLLYQTPPEELQRRGRPACAGVLPDRGIPALEGPRPLGLHSFGRGR